MSLIVHDHEVQVIVLIPPLDPHNDAAGSAFWFNGQPSEAQLTA